MSFFGGLALILLTLVGYSCGAVIAGRGRKEALNLLDLGLAVLFLALALGTRSGVGKWLAIPIWFILAGLGSALLTKARYKDHETKKIARQKTSGIGPFRRTWECWKLFATEMGNYQGRVLFAFFYFLIVTPFGLGVRLFGDPLKVKRGGEKTYWSERSFVTDKVEAARDQF